MSRAKNKKRNCSQEDDDDPGPSPDADGDDDGDGNLDKNSAAYSVTMMKLAHMVDNSQDQQLIRDFVNRSQPLFQHASLLVRAYLVWRDTRL